MTRAIDKRDVAKESVGTAAAIALASRVDLLVTLVASEAGRAGALLIVALVNLCVGVTKLDGNVADKLVLETDGLDAGDGFYDGGLSVSDVADGADVDCGLAGDNFRSERGESLDVEILGISLRGQRGLDVGLFADAVVLLEGRLEALVGRDVDGLARIGVGVDVVLAFAVGIHIGEAGQVDGLRTRMRGGLSRN